MFQLNFVLLLVVYFMDTFASTLLRKVSYATVTETMKTYQSAACDGEILSLDCPDETQISIQRVIYERSSPTDDICPKDPMHAEKFAGRNGLTCDIEEAHRSVEDLCEMQQNCTILTSPTLIGVSLYDPCPGVRKHIQVEYICEPSIFMSIVICQGQHQNLECDINANIAILSSFFENTELNTMCPLRSEIIREHDDSSQKTPEPDIGQCEGSEVTQAVSRDCHGHNSCKILSEPSLYGATDCGSKHILLNITYACILTGNFNPEFMKYIDKENTSKDLLVLQKSEHGQIKDIGEKEDSSFVPNYKDDLINVYSVNKKVKDEKTVQYMDTQKLSLTKDENFTDTKTMKTDGAITSVPLLNKTSKEVKLGNEAEFHINVTARASSPQNKNKSSNELHFASSPQLDMLYECVAGLNEIVQVIKKKSLQLLIVIFISVGIPLSCFLIFFIIRMYQICRSEEEEEYCSDEMPTNSLQKIKPH